MKFIIITKHDSKIVEAEDFEDAALQAWDCHTDYEYVQAIVRVPEN